jgi:hypothetical protein
VIQYAPACGQCVLGCSTYRCTGAAHQGRRISSAVEQCATGSAFYRGAVNGAYRAVSRNSYTSDPLCGSSSARMQTECKIDMLITTQVVRPSPGSRRATSGRVSTVISHARAVLRRLINFTGMTSEAGTGGLFSARTNLIIRTNSRTAVRPNSG